MVLKEKEEMMDIDYNKLKSFLMVVQCGSVTAAAKSLHRTQSAVSQALRGLERNLGLKLFEADWLACLVVDFQIELLGGICDPFRKISVSQGGTYGGFPGIQH